MCMRIYFDRGIRNGFVRNDNRMIKTANSMFPNGLVKINEIECTIQTESPP